MTYRVAKSACLALVAGGLLAGCATTIDTRPVTRYYEPPPVVSERAVVVPERVVTIPDTSYRSYVYREPAVTYAVPSTVDNGAVVYRESRVVTPTVTYYSPPMIEQTTQSCLIRDKCQ